MKRFTEQMIEVLRKQEASGKVRDECLNEHYLPQAREVLDYWRLMTTQSEHTSCLNDRTPSRGKKR